MAKPLNEFNKEFENRVLEGKDNIHPSKKKKGAAAVISSIIFYLALICMVVSTFIYSQNSKTGNNFFGFSYYNILTGSMNSVYPPGTFVLVHSVDTDTLNVGDDITFFKDQDTVITHRIIDAEENYNSSGQRAFRTQGTDNASPDSYYTYESNVIGKVVWSMPVLGFIFDYVANNVILIAIGLVCFLSLTFCLRVFFSKKS